MTDNSFGKLFSFTSFGESHGTAIGCVVDGVPPNLPLSESLIQPYLDRRRPGTSKFVTQRQEDDEVEILSGVFEGKTTGTPIGLLIRNKDQRSKDYGEIARQFRPGHADYTYQAKYGIRDHRGGGRSSARETAVRVAAGAIADLVLKQALGAEYLVRGMVTQIGPYAINRDNIDWNECTKNPFFARMRMPQINGQTILMACANQDPQPVLFWKLSPTASRPALVSLYMESWIVSLPAP